MGWMRAFLPRAHTYATHRTAAPLTFCLVFAFQLCAHSMTAAVRKKSEPAAKSTGGGVVEEEREGR